MVRKGSRSKVYSTHQHQNQSLSHAYLPPSPTFSFKSKHVGAGNWSCHPIGPSQPFGKENLTGLWKRKVWNLFQNQKTKKTDCSEVISPLKKNACSLWWYFTCSQYQPGASQYCVLYVSQCMCSDLYICTRPILIFFTESKIFPIIFQVSMKVKFGITIHIQPQICSTHCQK